MKANQNFRNADEAVSPVIGVILMVAITVVLAAVVFVLVSDLGDSGDSAPQLSFDKDTGAHTLTVVKGDADATWDDFAGSCSTGTAFINGAALSASSAAVTAGDVLTCDDTGAVAATLTLTHTPTNSLIGTYDL